MATGQLHSLILRQIYAQLVYRYHAENQFQQSNPQGATWRDWFLSHTGTHSKTPLIVSLVFIHSCVHTCSRIHRVPLFASDCHLRPQVFHCLLAVLKTFLSIQVTISHTASKEILISFVCNQGYGDSWVLGCTQPHGPRVWHHDKLMWHTECL